MPAISNIDQIVLQLRRQLAERAKRGGVRSPAGPNAPAESGRTRSLERAASGQAAAVHSAGGDSLLVGRAALEEILRGEFGQAFANDPGFLDIVDRVTEALHADTPTWTEIESWLGALQAG